MQASPSKITLKVKVSKHTPSFHLVIKILSLSGNMRLQFKFCRRMPYIGVLTFFFTKSPDIDYSIRPAGAVNVAGKCTTLLLQVSDSGACSVAWIEWIHRRPDP